MTVTVEDVAGWAAGLAAVAARIDGRFCRSESRRQVRAYLGGLIGAVERKNSWQLAEHAGDATPDRMQWLLGRATWDADLVRDDLRAYVLEHLGDAGAVLVGDETGFPKKGAKSVGVQRQYCGALGKVDNCQVGVLLAYASGRGAAFVDRELYLPESWTADRARRAEAGVPPAVAFRTKPELLRVMAARLLAAGVPIPWLTADEEYGSAPQLRAWLEGRSIPAALAVRASEPVTIAHTVAPVSWMRGARPSDPIPTAVTEATTVRAVAADLADDAWQTLSAGEGVQGPRLSRWALIELAEAAPAGWGRWLLIRRSRTDPAELAYYRVAAPADTPLAEMVRVVGCRWRIEDALGEAKGSTGLDHYEVRRWDGWYRHLTLSLFAHAFLVATRAAEKGATPSRTAREPSSAR
jgi:SRSO17 transposase